MPDAYVVSDDLVETFSKQGYVHLPGVFQPEMLSIMSNYFWMLMRKKGYFQKDPHAFLSKYGDMFNESLLVWLKPVFEKLTGLQLYPGYSYMRIYNRGNSLDRHVDREGCEFAATISIDYDADAPWPIFVRSGDKDVKFDLDRGDLVFYKGHQIQHWREPFEGNTCTQIFLFFVDANGPFKDYKYDKRNALGAPAVLEDKA